MGTRLWLRLWLSYYDYIRHHKDCEKFEEKRGYKAVSKGAISSAITITIAAKC